jgi:hypothetical protein
MVYLRGVDTVLGVQRVRELLCTCISGFLVPGCCVLCRGMQVDGKGEGEAETVAIQSGMKKRPLNAFCCRVSIHWALPRCTVPTSTMVDVVQRAGTWAPLVHPSNIQVAPSGHLWRLCLLLGC